MSVNFPYAAGVANPSIDTLVQKSFPAVTLAGQELNGTYNQVIEVNGSTWITTNAIYIQADGGFVQQNPLVPSSAFVIGPSGAVSQAVASNGAATPIVWTITPLSVLSLGLINVKDYGVSSTNTPSQNDTAFEAAFLTAAALGSQTPGGTVWIPPGVYQISQPITVYSKTKVFGQGYGSTTIKQTTLNADVFAVNQGSQYVEFLGLNLTYSSQATGGNAINLLNGTTANSILYVRIVACAWDACYNGVSMNGCQQVWIESCVSSMATGCLDNVNIGVQNNPTTGLIYQSSEIYSVNNSFGTSGGQPPGSSGLHIQAANGVFVVNDDYFGFGYGLYLNPGAGQSVYNCFFSNTAWDASGGSGVQISPANSSTALVFSLGFTGCWSSGSLATNFNMTAAGSAGVIDGVQITNHRSYNSKAYGFVIGTGATNILISNSLIADNVNSPGVGILVNTGCSNVTITNNRIGPNSQYAANLYGISIAGGSNVTIADNNVTGNATMNIQNLSPFATLVITGNEGYNGTIGSVGVLSGLVSGTAVQNTTGLNLTYYLSGGSGITAISVGPTAGTVAPTGMTGANTNVNVPAGSWFAVTFTTAPTVQRFEQAL